MTYCTAPAYPAAEAGRLVGLHPARVRRWLKGYTYRSASTLRRQPPVVRRERKTANSSYVSFLELVELLFVKQFLDHGISLQRIRMALAEAARILSTIHLAHRRVFLADSTDVFLRVQDKGDAILHLLSGGQWTIAPVIQELAKQIDFFDPPDEYARRWYPRGPDGLVVIDPVVSFGSPSLKGRGISTANVYDFFVAENCSHQAVKEWWGITGAEVEAAVDFERGLAA